jgi:hypothetical protein
MQLADVSDHACGPAAAGITAETALKARADVSKCDAFTVTEIAARTRSTHWVDAAGDTTKYRLNNNATGRHTFKLVSEIGDNLMTGNEGKRNDWFEIARTVSVDSCKVGTTDTSKARKDFDPTGTW